ncbi:hypothetical protein ACLMJK_008090 [Lecanora helva]
MEPVGFAVGIAGLAGAFTACVECFEYVQLGRQFGQDYGKCLLKLDAAKLRISRWGVAVGLGPEPYLKPRISATDKEIELAQGLLEQIEETFEDAKRISERFKKHTFKQNPNSGELLVCNATSDVDANCQRLHVTMRELALERQRGMSIKRKAIWALYEKRRFEGIIGDVVDYTNQLVDLFPTAQEDQKALCMTEVSAINKPQDLALLNNIAGKDDQMFSAEIIKELEKRGHNVTDWKAGGNSRMWVGDDNAFGVKSEGHNVARFTLSDHTDIHLGNINRGH